MGFPFNKPMNTRRTLIFLACLGTLLALTCFGASLLSAKHKTYTYAQLVGRLTDLKALAVPPVPGEKAGLASSYDRLSQYGVKDAKHIDWDAKSDNYGMGRKSGDTAVHAESKGQYDAKGKEYIDWDANRDFEGIIRMEGDTAVLAEIQGPGCIWRVWSGGPTAGHVKIYLDGKDTPAVDLPFSAYFDCSHEPFNRPGLVYTQNTTYTNNTPIPFQKSCKIVAEKGWGQYYHFNYTQFPPGTVVPTFHLPISSTDAAALDHANDLFLHPGQNPNVKSPKDQVIRQTVTAEPGKTTVIYDASGSGAITGLRVKFDLPDDKDIEAQRTLLRQLALRITWDKQSQPSVWSPLGDFFGSPACAMPFDSLTTGLGKDGYFYCYWYMPFGSHATLSIDNDGEAPLPMQWEITRAKLTQKPGNLLRFHAKWHRDAFLPERPDRKIDWTLLTTQGKGRLVGTQLHVWNPRPTSMLWNQGDEKFFVDGEGFPSIFGTGTSNYFGRDWSRRTIFTTPLHGQTYTENNGFDGPVSLFRWHVADNIPFQISFEGAIEKYPKNECPCLYAAVAYWYLDPSGRDPYPTVPVSERIGYWVRPPEYHAPNSFGRELGCINADPEHSASSRASADFQIPPQVASDDSVYCIRIKTVGQKVIFTGPRVEKDGGYKLQARVFKGPGSGIYQFAVDGIPIGNPVDLYSPSSIKESAMSSDSLIDIGHVDLTPGEHLVSIALVGNNEKADAKQANRPGRFECILNYIKLEPDAIQADPALPADAPVSSVTSIQHKLDSIVVSFNAWGPLSSIIKTLNTVARQNDTAEPDPSKRGVPIYLKGKSAPGAGTQAPPLADAFGDTIIRMSLDNIPLGKALSYIAACAGDVEVKVGPESVELVPYPVSAMDAIKTGNSGHKESESRLIGQLKDKTDTGMARSAAAFVLCRLKATSAVPVFIDLLKNKDESTSLRTYAAVALREIENKSAIPVLLDVLNDKSDCFEVREQCVYALGTVNDPTVVPILGKFLIDENGKDPVAISAMVALTDCIKMGSYNRESALPVLREMLKDSKSLKFTAAIALAMTGDKTMLPVGVDLLCSSDRGERLMGIGVLRLLGGKDAIAAIKIAADKEADPQMRQEMNTAIQTAILAKIVIDRLELHEATLTEALDFLRLKAKELGADSFYAVIANMPVPEPRITLSLSNIPITDAVQSVAIAAGLQARADSHGFVLEADPVGLESLMKQVGLNYQAAEKLERDGNPREALDKYKSALRVIEETSKANPSWKTREVEEVLRVVREKIDRLTALPGAVKDSQKKALPQTVVSSTTPADATTATADPFAKIIIDKADFSNATLTEAVGFLRLKAREQANASFDIVITKMPVPEPRISLSLSKIPITAALHFVAQGAGMQVRANSQGFVLEEQSTPMIPQ